MRKRACTAALAIGFLPFSVPAADTPAGPAATAIIAYVDGTPITRAEFENKHRARLFQARNTYFEAEQKAVEEFINQYLLERQARKENVSVQALLEKHVSSKIAQPPSEDALRVYYEGVDTTESYEAVRDKIIEHLRQRRLTKAKSEYLKTLRDAASISLSLKPPRAEVSMENTPVRGVSYAAVVVVEFADYECPYCQQIQPALDKLESEYKGKIAFAYKDAPLPIHATAQKAAEAAHCAGRQGRFWDYHDVLARSRQLQLVQLKQHARDMKLDTASFDKCLDSGEVAYIVKSHLAEAQTFGLQGTPSFFINGRFYSGALSYEKLRDIVEEELSRSGEERSARR
jgi:protein-disulfide isomerase